MAGIPGNRIRTLLPGNDVGVTRMDAAPFGLSRKGRRAAAVRPRTRVVTTPVPFVTVAGESKFIINENRNRVGLYIQNLDNANAMFVGFRTDATTLGLQMVAQQSLLLDMVCPTDAISVYSTVALSGLILEFTRVTV